MKKLLILIMLSPAFTNAQNWTATIGGGVSTNTISDIYGYQGFWKMTANPALNISVRRDLQDFDLGISVSWLSFKASLSDYIYYGTKRINEKYYFARDAYPISAIFNRKLNDFYAGVNFGLCPTGGSISTFDTTGPIVHVVHSPPPSLGVTLGLQAGYRLKISKKIELGLQVQASYLAIKLDDHKTSLFYFPGLLSLGYKF